MIVKNCPSFDSEHNGCASHKTTSADCEKNANCIMKQIVNGCIAHIEAREILLPYKILNILEVE